MTQMKKNKYQMNSDVFPTLTLKLQRRRAEIKDLGILSVFINDAKHPSVLSMTSVAKKKSHLIC